VAPTRRGIEVTKTVTDARDTDARPPNRADSVSVEVALQQWPGYSAIIDARSESEFLLDHLPNAANYPVLGDAEREQIGTEYKQVSAFSAKKRGAVMAARNIANHIEAHWQNLPADWRPLVYCWRGGKRSGSMVTILRSIGWPAQQLEGGYKAFRRHVAAELATLPATLDFRVLTGATGSGKSRILQALAASGEQVLDIEAIGCHKGSVLGELPHAAQPTQKLFESQLWWAMRRFDPARTVFAEAESQRLGQLRVPPALIGALRASPCLEIDASVATRAALLLTEYPHFESDRASLVARLNLLCEYVPATTMSQWHELAQAPDLTPLVQELLVNYYDPLYKKSTGRNYAASLTAPKVALGAATDAAIGGAAGDCVAAIIETRDKRQETRRETSDKAST
jgi:tRNA 2-selenouridine synthase